MDQFPPSSEGPSLIESPRPQVDKIVFSAPPHFREMPAQGGARVNRIRIYAHIQKFGGNMGEIANVLHIGSTTVQKHIDALVRDGHINVIARAGLLDTYEVPESSTANTAQSQAEHTPIFVEPERPKPISREKEEHPKADEGFTDDLAQTESEIRYAVVTLLRTSDYNVYELSRITGINMRTVYEHIYAMQLQGMINDVKHRYHLNAKGRGVGYPKRYHWMTPANVTKRYTGQKEFDERVSEE